MPVFFPSNVSTFSPTVNPVIFLSDNHGKGIGYFDAISGGNTNRNDIASGFRAPGFLAIVYDSTTPDADMYVYTSTATTDAAWTTTSNWTEFGGSVVNKDLGGNDLTQTADARTYDLDSASRTNPSLTFKDGATQDILKISENAGNYNVDIDGVALNLKTATDLRLEDDAGGQYVGLSAPSAVSASYTLEFPAAVATGDRLIQTDSSGVLSYAQASFSSNTLVIGAQSVDLSGLSSDNLATANLVQTASEDRTFTVADGQKLSFLATGGTSLLEINDTDTALYTGNTIPLRFNDADGSAYVGVVAPSAVTSYTLTLPNAVASGGDRLIQSDTSGNLSYAAASFTSNTLVIGAQSVDISGAGTNTNLGNTDLSSSATNRFFNLAVSGSLGFRTSGSSNLLSISAADSAIKTGANIPIRLLDQAAGDYVGLAVPSSVTSYTLTFPNEVAAGDRLIQTDSSGNLSYAELSYSTNTLVIGAQSVDIGGNDTNLATANLTQSDTARTYDLAASGTLAFRNSSSAALLTIDNNGQVITGNAVDLRLSDDTGGEYVGFSAPSAVSTSYTLTFPDAVATDDRLIQTDSSGVLSYAELTIGGNTIAIGAQSVHVSNIEFEGVAGVAVGNVSVGQEFDAGSDIQDLFNAIFVAFDIGSISKVSGGTTVAEHGDSVVFNDLCPSTGFNVTFSSPSQGTDNTLDIVVSGSNVDGFTQQTLISGAALPTDTSPTQTIAQSSMTFTTASNVTISDGSATGSVRVRANAQDDGGTDQFTSFSTVVSVRYRTYFFSSTTDLNSSSSQGTFDTLFGDVGSGALKTSRAGTNTTDSGNADSTKFTYFVQPEDFGAISAISLNGDTNVYTAADGGAFVLIGTNYTQSVNGETVTYRTYQSDTKAAYTSGQNLIVS